MAGDQNRGGGPPQPEPTADECIRAGMYWFGRSDFAAAEAWWQRALELDPRSTRAQECLRLLHRTSSTGFKDDSVNPFLDPDSRRSNPFGAGGPEGYVVPDPPLDDLPMRFESEPAGLRPMRRGALDASYPAQPAPGRFDPPSPAAPAPQSMRLPESASTKTPIPEGDEADLLIFDLDPLPSRPSPVPTDPFDFASKGDRSRVKSEWQPGEVEPKGHVRSPWDDGPSRTSVVTLEAESNFDAVADPTPLPELDRSNFFGRGDPESRDEIVDFLRATGDLPVMPRPPRAPGAADGKGAPPPRAPPRPAPPEDIVFDDPVEVAAPEPAEPPPSPATDASPAELLAELEDRFRLHDFNAVIDLAERISPDAPEHVAARNRVAEARVNLMKMYESKIGSFDRVPRVLISNEEVIWLNLNHRAGFILSQIDGIVTYDDLMSLSGMPRLDTVRILAELLSERVIGVS